MEFYPIPDDAYRIIWRGKRKVTEMTNDDLLSTITEIDDVIVERASWYAYRALYEEPTTVAMYLLSYETLIRNAIKEDGRRPAKWTVLRPFNEKRAVIDDYKNPFWRGNDCR